MNDSTLTPDIREERKRKRRPIVAALLAILAVGGVGAAATSAAWTDNVLFGIDAAAATFDLQGSVNATGDWNPAGTPGEPARILVPEAAFANLLPGQTRTVTLYLHNAGSVTAQIQTPVGKAWENSTFETAPSVEVTGLPSTLAAGDTTPFTVTITTTDTWDDENIGDSGTLVVTVAGQAIAG